MPVIYVLNKQKDNEGIGKRLSQVILAKNQKYIKQYMKYKNIAEGLKEKVEEFNEAVKKYKILMNLLICLENFYWRFSRIFLGGVRRNKKLI